MQRDRTAWELWALALLGLWLKFFRGKPAPSPTSAASSHVHPATTGMSPGQALSSGMISALHGLGLLLVLAAVGGLIWLTVRSFMRRRRFLAMTAEEIVLGPDDNAGPDELVAVLDSIHTALMTRYGGSVIGQVSWTFEIIRDADAQVHFVLAAPHQWLPAIEDIWRNAYTNLRFLPWGDRPRTWPIAQQIGLTRPWQYPTRMESTYNNSVIELIVQAIDRAEGEVYLQWHLTPLAAGPLSAQLRKAMMRDERAAGAARQTDPAHPGLGMVGRQEMMQAAELAGHAVYRTEIRLAADNWNDMQRVYGALASANAANQWRPRTVLVGRRLWSQWLFRRVPSAGLFGSVILVSKPLATLIHVPSARLRVQSLTRKLVRRGPAPPAIPRSPELAILRDEKGLVGMPEGDRKYNTLFIGSQGGGKSTAMLQQIRVDGQWRDRSGAAKALVIIDIGKDTAKRALGLIAPERDVIWFDPSDPSCPWTLNPLAAGVHEDALANDVIEGLTQVFGDDAIRARSREFLGNAILAVKEVHGENADFTMVYKMLTDHTFRQNVIDRVTSPHQRDYWQVTFTNTVANNPRFVEEGLAAPRNKLDEVLRSQAISAALTTSPGRHQLDLHEVIQGRKVLIANLDKAKLGKAGARLLGIFLITMVWHALESQTDVPEAERVPTALVIDEAQNFISEGFLDILAEGRAYGAQTTLAVRFLGEILSDRAILGVRTLVQNLVIYQFELREEAEDFMKRFMRTYSNMISPNDEAQDNINFGADDFMRLPKHHVVCRWMVDGSPQQAFLAETIPWEEQYHEAWRTTHLARQPQALPPGDAAAQSGADDGYGVEEEWLDGGEFGDTAPTEAVLTPASESSESSSDTDWADDPETDPTGAAWPAPLWLAWLDPAADPATWWDAQTGAGTPVLWTRLAQQPGVPVLWELEGLDVAAAAWRPWVRRRAVQVAQHIGGPQGILAWVDDHTLGCLLPPGTVVDADHWVHQAQQHNVHWHHVTPDAPSPAAPASASVISVSPPSQSTPSTSAAVVSNSSSGLDPLLWNKLERQSGLTRDQVLAWQTQYKATTEEIAGTVRWAVDHHLAPKTASATFLKVLRQKMQDRWIHPICDQVGASRKAVADVLLASDHPLAYWGRWMKQHPEITTVDALRQAVRQDVTPPQAVP